MCRYIIFPVIYLYFKMKLYVVLFVTSAAFFNVVSSKIPEYIHVCKKNDNQCLTDSANHVIKHLTNNGLGRGSIKVPDIKNVKVAKMPLDAGDLHITLTDAIFHGLENLRMKSLNMNDKEIKFSCTLPHLEYIGEYKMDGRILILPIQGEGKFNISHFDLSMDLTCKLKTDERNGKKYYHLDGNWDDVQMNMKVKRSNFHFENLFGGDPRLGPEMNKFLNENDAEVFTQIEPAMKEGAGFYIFLPFMNAFFTKIPIDDLFEN